jgi:hypothetical protein
MPYVYASPVLGGTVRFCRDEVRRDHHRVSGRQGPAMRTRLPTMPHDTASRTLARLASALMPITVRGRVAVATRTRSRRYGRQSNRQCGHPAPFRTGRSVCHYAYGLHTYSLQTGRTQYADVTATSRKEAKFGFRELEPLRCQVGRSPGERASSVSPGVAGRRAGPRRW